MTAAVVVKPTLLIVDDEKPTRDGLRAAVEEHYDVYVAEDMATALELLKHQPFDVLLTDFRLPKGDGMKLIAHAKTLLRKPVCILMTAYGSEDLAVQAIRAGADDYIAKGRMQLDELEMRIARAQRREKLREAENLSLRQQIQSRFKLEDIVGETPAMKEVFEIVQQVAPSKASVLILGESGTGKELIAKAIHHLSPRSQQPLVTVHCAVLSPTLLESELFGHEKGAFTGAHERRIGRFEQAQSFRREFAEENSKAVNEFTAEAMDALRRYRWPGNVRELRTAIEHAVVLCRGEKITLGDLPPNVRVAGGSPGDGTGAAGPAPADLTIKEAEKQLIIRALKECEANRTAAAKKLGMSRRTLHRKLHAYHLEGF